MRVRFVVLLLCVAAVSAYSQQSATTPTTPALPANGQSQTSDKKSSETPVEKSAAFSKLDAKTRDYATESFVIERLHTTYRFENDGDRKSVV